MKQVIARGGEVVVADLPAPSCGSDELLISNAYSLISTGTETWTIGLSKPVSAYRVLADRAMLRKAISAVRKAYSESGLRGMIQTSLELRQPYAPLGYSCSGTVIEVGENIDDIRVGDSVACAGEGKACHAEIVAVPRNLVARVPPNVSLKEASFATVGSIAMHGVRRAGVQFGETAVIIGTGLVGQLSLQIAKVAGCKVVAIDTNPLRVELAVKNGADLGLLAGKDTLQKEIEYFTSGLGADAVVVCAASHSSEPLNQAAAFLRDKGRIVVVGRTGMELDRTNLYWKELDVLMSRSAGPGRYDPLYENLGIDYPVGWVRWTENRNMQAFLELLGNRRVQVTHLISSEFPVSAASEAYRMLQLDKTTMAVLLTYNPSQYISLDSTEKKSTSVVAVSPRPVSTRIQVAVFGAGHFAKETLLPILKNIRDYNLRWIATATPISARRAAKRYRVEYCTTDFGGALSDPRVDLVAIATPNNLHYPMIMQAAKAGKAVFTEKPMCITENELDEIIKIREEMKVPIFVGFNRRYAPLIQSAKRLLKNRHPPYLIQYRVNAGYIPQDSWVHDPLIGGGRIVAECCHFFDLFYFLTEAEAKTIEVSTIPVNQRNVVAKDNLVASISWSDGSITTLTYTALGNPLQPRERIEVFADGGSLAIDDFKTMFCYGFGSGNTHLQRQDKGHFAEFVELSKYMRGKPSSIISFDDCVRTMRLTLAVDAMARRV